ncbi:MAG: AI-2E family transporter, partial [Akkermansia sp.]|nr:AI-2E family transporter [Akkermansia sp.]
TLLLPVQHRARGVRAAREMKRETAAFLRGQLLLSLAVGSMTALGLAITGTPGWLLLGILMGVMEMVPYVGPVLAGVPAVLLAAGGAFLLGRQQAEPVQEEGAAQVKAAPDKQELVLSDEFYEKACSQLGIPAVLQCYEELLNKAAACRESYASKLESLYNAGVEDARTHAFRSRPKERGFSIKEMQSPGKTAMKQIGTLLQDWRGEMEGLRYEQLQIVRALQTGIRDIEKYCTWNTAEERMLLEKTGLRLEKDYADCLSTHAIEQIQKEFEAQCMEQYRSLTSLWYARAEENIRKWETEKAEADAAVLTDEMYHQMSEKRGFSQLLAERKAMDEQAQEIARAGVLAMENELAVVRQTLDAVDADTEESPREKLSWLGIDFYNQYNDSIYKIKKDYIDGRLYALHQEYYEVLKPQLERYRADSYQKPDDDEMSEMEKRMEALFLERAKKEYAQVIKTTPYLEPFKYFSKERERIEHEMHSLRQAKKDALWKREREMEAETQARLQGA